MSKKIVSEETKGKILNGIEKVLKMDGFSVDFIAEKRKEVAKVFDPESDVDGGQAQEIILDSDAFTDGLEDLSETMSHSDRYKL